MPHTPLIPRGCSTRPCSESSPATGASALRCSINAGRGGLQREADILRALDDGTLGYAVLDVFVREPLDRGSPLWRHPARDG